MKSIITSLLFLFSMIVSAYDLQDAVLSTSLYKKGTDIDFFDFYTYLKTEQIIFNGKNAFESLTFRGEGIQVLLDESTSQITATILGKKIILANLETPVDQLADGLQTLNINSGIKVRLDHASLGKAYKVKVASCLPGLPCLPHKITVVPHRYKITIVAPEGEAFCITRDFNQTKETNGKIDDIYSLGECK